MFIANDVDSQDVAVVRVKVKSTADFADLDFRAGYVDTAAIDDVVHGEILSETKPTDDQEPKLMAMRAAAVASAILDVQTAYAKPWSQATQAEAAAAEEKLLRARSILRRSRASETSAVPEAPAEKYVIAVSANPDAVFNALANATSQQAQSQTMVDAVRSLATRAATKENLQNTAAQSLWKAKFPQEDPLGEDAEVSAVGQRLREYGQQLEDFLSLTQ